MDYNEYEISPSNIDETSNLGDEMEFVIAELNSIAHAGGRYSRSVQIPRARYIISTLKKKWLEEQKQNNSK